MLIAQLDLGMNSLDPERYSLVEPFEWQCRSHQGSDCGEFRQKIGAADRKHNRQVVV